MLRAKLQLAKALNQQRHFARTMMLGMLIVAILSTAALNPLGSSMLGRHVSSASVSAQAMNATGPSGQSPSQRLAPAAKPPNYLSTSGSKIVDSAGNEVRLTGVNWFGMETQTFSPHGLWARSWRDMLDQIVTAGFNTIRLPFSSAIFDPNARPMEGIDYNLNPDLKNLTALQIMDKIVEGAGERGLKIVLDRHRPNTEAQSKLWYTDDVSESQWIAEWQTLAKRYLNNDAVIGADLHNEPAGDATWGSGDPKTDWRAAAERAGNAILDVNPNWLIIVEGVEKIDKDWYWMGGNLANAGSNAINLKVPNKLVYSAHDYGPGVYDQDWFKDPQFPANLPQLWDKHWGYLVEQGIAPVILGEFGGRSVSSTDTEGVWQRTLLNYLQDHSVSFTYWALNPNSADTGGLLEDDWQTVDVAKEQLLHGYLTPRLAVNDPDVVDQNAVATESEKNPLPAQPLKAQLAAGSTADSVDQLSLNLSIVNQTAAHVPLSAVELRYYLSAADASWAGVALTASNDKSSAGKGSADSVEVRIDWASVAGARSELVDGAGTGIPYLRITFKNDAPAMDSFGKAEMHLQVNRPDPSAEGPFSQAGDYSFKASNTPVDDDAIALYFWGERIWGSEPPPGNAPGGRASQMAGPGTGNAPAAATAADTAGAASSGPDGMSQLAAITTPVPQPATAPSSAQDGSAASGAAAGDNSGATSPPPAVGNAAESSSAAGTGNLPAAVSAQADAAAPRKYVVKPGDTLQRIATQFYGDPSAWKRIAAANADQIKNPDLIMPGQVFVIPPP